MGNLKHFNYEKLKKRLKEKNNYEQAEKTLMEFNRFIQENIQEICHCYAGMLKQTLEELVDIMLIDAVFVMELSIRKLNTTKYNNDYILSKPYLSKAVALDFLLLENQVPFSILEELYKYVPALPTSQKSSFLELACWYFAYFDPQKGSSEKLKRKHIVQVIHFTDLVRNFYLPIHLNFRSWINV
ncbi:hypothetical protein L6164_003573 [Bauhinia variegata]|uniref:Uncharacterized protein n=1 Tax=Bauhinia variegata TaxID=167791 RepID=A0ACB9Q1S0_BAUVA|nr:hypothetical protein L6164_003573 [Bauhinia variegata]